MRFHVVSLPHTQTTKDFVHCAYTTKVVRFCNMMTSLGHDVFLYSSEDNKAEVAEHISVIPKNMQELHFKKDHRKTFFPIEWNSDLPYWKYMNTNAIGAISKRIESKDFICLIGGTCQKPIADAFAETRNEYEPETSGVTTAFSLIYPCAASDALTV